MATPANIAPNNNVTSLAARIAWFLLICATLYVCYFSHLGAIGFVGPDEPRYAWVAREMAETGDWITPRLYGKPWFEKPPLYYWGAALCFKLFGVSEVSARLPSAFSALLATLALAWLARRLYGADTARWLLLLLPTTVGMIGFSHAAATDMPFSAMLTIAMVCAAVLLECGGEPPLSRSQAAATKQTGAPPIAPSPSPAPLISENSSPFFPSLLFGFFLALAALAKGPAALILCGGSIFFWALFTKRWRAALRLLHPAAMAAFSVTALPWYILCAHRNPDFFRIFIIEHNFKRYLTPEFQHLQPFWFYASILLAALLPWTLLLIPLAAEAKQALQDRAHHYANIVLACWSAFPILFFTLSKSKLPGYILPSIPPLALLCSHATKKLLQSNSRFARAILCGTAIIAIVSVLAAIRYSVRLHELAPFPQQIDDGGVRLGLLRFAGLLLGLAAPILVLLRRSRAGALCTAVGLIAVLWSPALTNFDSTLSPRQVSEAVSRMGGGPNTEVLLCGVTRSARYGLNFYLHRELADWEEGNLQGRTLVLVGEPACWNKIKKANYSFRGEMDFPRWTLAEIDPLPSAPPADRQPQ